jgi:hypothetical protein
MNVCAHECIHSVLEPCSWAELSHQMDSDLTVVIRYYVHTYVCEHVYVLGHTFVCEYVCALGHTYVCEYVYVLGHTYVCDMCMFLAIHMSVICVCSWPYICL